MVKTSSENHLRLFDARRDVTAVADLVELCFADTLDADGRRYLQHMRSTANTAGLLGWTRMSPVLTSTPLAGYVWEQDGQIIGNASLIPYYVANKRFYLIANVAVHPDYRRMGIARQLTKRLIERVRLRGASQIWLHVRDDNQAALNLYQSEGFVERTRRTTWINRPDGMLEELNVGASFSSPRTAHWTKQSAWLLRTYPAKYAWHLAMDTKLLRPGVLGGIWRMVNNAHIAQWSMQREKRLLGVASWQSSHGASDLLFLALPEKTNDEDVQALLVHALKRIPSPRPVSMDYPTGQYQRAIEVAGFNIRQTLIWMELLL